MISVLLVLLVLLISLVLLVGWLVGFIGCGLSTNEPIEPTKPINRLITEYALYPGMPVLPSAALLSAA